MKTTTIVVILIIYMLGILYIGWRSTKQAQGFDDFLTAGRKGKLHMIIGSYLGAHLGTGIVIGGAAYGVTHGIGGVWYGLGAAGSYLLFGLVTAKWAYRHKYLTIPAYLRERFPATGKAMTVVWALLGSAVGISTICGQIIAGRALFTYLGIDPLIGTLLSVAVVTAYCAAAGMFGVIATDFIQSVIIFIGLIIAIICCFGGGGLELVQNTLDASHWNFVPFETSTLLLMCLPTAIYGITGGANMQLTASSDSEKTAFRAPLIACLGVVFITFIPVLVGMYGATAFPEAEANTIIFTVILQKLPTLIAGLMLAAIVAAVMSTVDTTVMTCVTSLVYDAYGNVIAPAAGHKTEEKKMRGYATLMSVIIMALSTALAFLSNDIIGILSSGYTIWVAGGMIPFLLGRFWKGCNSYGALASMVVGSLFAWLNIAGVTHFVTSLICLIPAAIAAVVVSLLTKETTSVSAE